MSARKEKKEKEKESVKNLRLGMELLSAHNFFGSYHVAKNTYGKKALGRKTAIVTRGDRRGYSQCVELDINEDMLLSPQEWAYLLAHQSMHAAFGHFDAACMIGENRSLLPEERPDKKLWNLACDLYNMQFMRKMKCGTPPFQEIILPASAAENERTVYQYLKENTLSDSDRNALEKMSELVHMEGIKNPKVYEEGQQNPDVEYFSAILRHAVLHTLSNTDEDAPVEKTAADQEKEWFIAHFPLLGGLAASFRIVENYRFCRDHEIQVAAVEAERRTIYLNPAANLSQQELRFVLAHEMLHAGLLHHTRCGGRNSYLWNIACDFVINDWLKELQIGDMPHCVLYDAAFHGMSAESVYDRLASDFRRSMKNMTFRGYGKGDVMVGESGLGLPSGSLDDFFREALEQGIQYHEQSHRGYLPAGLIEEIRSLAMPPVPWDVKLAEWFQERFPDPEIARSYARASRRQSCTPDIPRPGRVDRDQLGTKRTFGVVIDTSGSMDVNLLVKGLGSIVSLAVAKEVPYVRVVFCDAAAYDAGYLSPEDIAGCVEVKGRGGTKLQPGIDLLRDAKDFPKDGSILIITDGMIEDKLHISRDHAFLLPAGGHLPFIPRGNVFYFR